MLSLRSLVVVAMATVLAQGETTVLVERAIDEVYRVRVATVRHSGPDPHVVVHVTLQQRAAPQTAFELTTYRASFDHDFSVERVTARVIVLYWRSDPYGYADGYTKLFLDVPRQRIEKRIDYEEREVAGADDRQAAAVMVLSPAELGVLRVNHVLAKTRTPPPLPQLLIDHPLPQSTVAAALAVRPEHTANGLTQKDFAVQETIEAFQEEAGRIWFGKSFYDAEGETGLGAIGFIDKSGAYTFLRVPEIALWSVGALLVEKDTIWAGLMHRGEGRNLSGGLLQYDRATGRAVIHRVPDVIHTLVNLNGTVFAGTDRGVYALRGRTLTRYRLEPDINGNFIVISQRL